MSPYVYKRYGIPLKEGIPRHRKLVTAFVSRKRRTQLEVRVGRRLTFTEYTFVSFEDFILNVDYF